VSGAAVHQQQQMHDSHKEFCDLISSAAQGAKATWPLFHLPEYELHAGNLRKQCGAEAISIVTRVKDEDAAAALQYVSSHYESWVKESHMTRYGNLDRLNSVGFHPTFTVLGATGFEPDTANRSLHHGIWQSSPRTYSGRPHHFNVC
jgi:hypothetical protein